MKKLNEIKGYGVSVNEKQSRKIRLSEIEDPKGLQIVNELARLQQCIKK